MAKTPTDIRSLARAHTATAINTLASIMKQAKAPHAARVAACNSLLDRAWGKAPQSVTLKDERDRLDELTDAELDSLIALARARTESPGGSTEHDSVH